MTASGANVSGTALMEAQTAEMPEPVDPLANVRRMTGPFAKMEKNAEILKVGMGVGRASELFAQDQPFRSLTVASAMPDVAKKVIGDYSKTILGQAGVDPLKVSGLKFSAAAPVVPKSFLDQVGVLPPRTAFDTTLLVTGFSKLASPDGALTSVREAMLLGLPKGMLNKSFYGQHSAVAAAAGSVRTLGASSALYRGAVGSILGRQVQVPKGFDVKSVIQTAMRANGGLSASMRGSIGLSQTLNSQLLGPAFRGSEWAAPFASSIDWGVAGFDAPFYDDDGLGVWTPGDAWTTVEDGIDWLLRTGVEVPNAAVADLLTRFLYARFMFAQHGTYQTTKYFLEATFSLSAALGACAAIMENPNLLLFFFLALALRGIEGPSGPRSDE